MTFTKGLVTCGTLALIICSSAFANTEELDPPAQFVAQLNQLVQEVFEQSEDELIRHASICRLIDHHADSNQMATMALGHHVKRFSTEQLGEYQSLFRNMLADMFEKAFEKMRDANVRISPNSLSNSEGAVVAVMVEPRNRSAIRFQFFLAARDNGFRMVDASMSGSRLIFAKRSSFERVLSSAPRDPESAAAQALLEELKAYGRPCP